MVWALSLSAFQVADGSLHFRLSDCFREGFVTSCDTSSQCRNFRIHIPADLFVYVSVALIFDEFTGNGIGTHRARWSLFRTSGESVDGLPSLSAGVSEIYGSRR